MNELIRKHNLKMQLGTAIAVIGFIIYWTFVGTSQLGKMDMMIENTADLATRNKGVIVQLQEASIAKEMTLVEIKVKLSGIETTLAEIKQDLKTR